MAVGTHWPTTYDICGHVLSGQMHELRRGTNVQFRRFLYGACDSVCNTIRSFAHSYHAAANRRPICGRLGTDPEPTGSGPNQIQY